jgi:hypothetical protein
MKSNQKIKENPTASTASIPKEKPRKACKLHDIARRQWERNTVTRIKQQPFEENSLTSQKKETKTTKTTTKQPQSERSHAESFQNHQGTN